MEKETKPKKKSTKAKETKATEKEINPAKEEAVVEEKKEEPVVETPKVEQIPTPVTQPKKKSNKGVIIAIVCSVILTVVVLGVIAALLINGLTGSRKTPPTKIEVDPPVTESAYRISGNGLEDFDLYFLQLENKQDNVIYSPLSIKYALAMLNEGTDGRTHEQIANVIGDYKAKKYNNNEHMSFANAMFIRNTFKDSIKSEYIDTLSSNYGAEVIYDDFQNASTMNNWVSNKTFKLINGLLSDDLVKDGNFFIVNALAIDMNWTTRIQSSSAPLPEGMTQRYYHVNYAHENYSEYINSIMEEKYPSMSFNGNDDIKSVKVGASFNRYDIISDLGEENIRKTVTEKYESWMKETGDNCGTVEEYVNGYIKALGENYKQEASSTDFYAYEDDDVRIFAKDLQKYDGTTLQYVGVMPKQVTLSSYVKDLTANELKNTIDNMKEVKYENYKEGVVTKVVGSIPLFKYDYKLDLMGDLQALGIEDVFDVNKADMSKMTQEKQYIYDSTHKATIEFSNDGIKAAAATSMGGAGAAGCPFDYKYEVPVEVIDVTFDNPYLYIIRDKDSGEVWFVGTVYNPTSNK